MTNFKFLVPFLVPVHPGNPRQSPGDRKTVVVVVVVVTTKDFKFCTLLSTMHMKY